MQSKIKKIFSAIGRFFAPAGRLLSPVRKVLSSVWGFIKKHKIILGIIIFVLAAVICMKLAMPKKGGGGELSANEVTIERTTIEKSITGSSVAEANDEYSVKALVSGEILKADFEEGDIIEKGQVLYKIDADDVENSIESSDINVEKAQLEYNRVLKSHTDEIIDINGQSSHLSVQRAQNQYSDAAESTDDLTVTADFSGMVSEVYVSEGDEAAVGTKIADIIDNANLEVRVPFNTADAENIHRGEAATVTLVSTGAALDGVVAAVGSGSETLNGNMRVSYVTIKVSNPGGVKEGDSVTAMVGEYACNDVGSFEPSEKKTLTAKTAGKITGVWIIKGDYVQGGSTVATMESDTITNSIRDSEITLREARLKEEGAELESMDAEDYATKLKKARFALDDAILQRDKLKKQLEDYTITSPISGTVVTKNKKVGDKIESTMGAAAADTNVLAVIYDMSSLCFQLDVDELDVKNIKVGQGVEITADAVADKTYKGEVETVSINGTVGTNGVTTYPVKVRIKNGDEELLPGMNIEAEISVERAEDVIAVPVAAVNRGDTVYVKGEKDEEGDKAPEGFKTIEVEIGISNDSFAEVISGLNEGDIVYTPKAEGDEQPGGMAGMMGGMHGGMMGGSSGGGGGMPPGGGPPAGGGGMK